MTFSCYVDGVQEKELASNSDDFSPEVHVNVKQTFKKNI